MGRQILLYQTSADERAFIDYVLETGDVWILPEINERPDPSFSKTLHPRTSEADGSTVFLYNKATSAHLVAHHLEKRRKYALDGFNSSVIGFSKCRLSQVAIRPGRLWVETKILDERGSQLRLKEPEFLRWYDDVAKWVRRACRHRSPLTYAAPGALRFEAEGGRLD